MPFALSGLVLGALVGALIARKRKGRMVDILQYSAAYGILFALIGLICALIAFRMMS